MGLSKPFILKITVSFLAVATVYFLWGFLVEGNKKAHLEMANADDPIFSVLGELQLKGQLSPTQRELTINRHTSIEELSERILKGESVSETEAQYVFRIAMNNLKTQTVSIETTQVLESLWASDPDRMYSLAASQIDLPELKNIEIQRSLLSRSLMNPSKRTTQDFLFKQARTLAHSSEPEFLQVSVDAMREFLSHEEDFRARANYYEQFYAEYQGDKSFLASLAPLVGEREPASDNSD